MTRFPDTIEPFIDDLDLAGPLTDGTDPVFMSALPRSSLPDFPDDLSSQSGATPAGLAVLPLTDSSGGSAVSRNSGIPLSRRQVEEATFTGASTGNNNDPDPPVVSSSSSSSEKSGSEASPSASNTDPPIPPDVVTAPEDAESDDDYTPRREYPITDSPILTPSSSPFNNEQKEPLVRNILDRVESVMDKLLSRVFSGGEQSDGEGAGIIPAALPPPRNPSPGEGSAGSSGASYVNQRDLEEALGREAWTMCCATTFVNVVQAKYPGIECDRIVKAAGAAAETPLSDGSGNCVAGDGYVSSIYQYTQALSKNLELDEYVDVSGVFRTVEEARETGAEAMKLKLSGTINDTNQQHHILNVGDKVIDPIPGNGFESVADEGSIKIEQVMALDWYPLP